MSDNEATNAKLPFDEALEKLEEIVRQLEEGRLSLEDSMKAFEEGVKLQKLCAAKLSEASQKIELLTKKENGEWGWQEVQPRQPENEPPEN